MSDVQFEESQNITQHRSFNNVPVTPPLVRLVMSLKMTQDEETANKILVGIAIGAFVMSMMLIKIFLFPSQPEIPDLDLSSFSPEERAALSLDQ